MIPARWILRLGFGIAILTVLLMFVVLPLGFSWAIVNGRRMSPDLEGSRTPARFGLAYESVDLESQPDLRLRGWFLPAVTSGRRDTPKGTVILLHGWLRSRSEMLTRGVFLAESGYDSLLIDLRNHGQSGGELSSLGFYESDDVVAAVDYVRARGDFCSPIALWGVSMGATAALLGAAKTPMVDGVIADSTFLSFEDTIVHHAELFFNLPRFPVADLTILFVSWYLGFRREDFDLRTAVKHTGARPILFVAGGSDRRMPPEIAYTLFEASPSSRKAILVVAGAGHGAAYRTDPTRYQQAVLTFLETIPAPCT